ncbi:MAG: DUF4290 domain-containing protein [Odoribacteraceae bacterium]|jgi:hypothetical protein|nr:DUF4290 domain-containing protein [Odoribacteraceae bacterium]
MDYNTERKRLLLPEYGRHIQTMVDEVATIKDREERTLAAKAVINVMGNLYPHLRDILDFRHKLWDHLAIMSNFSLDIDTPYPVPARESLEKKPDKMEYCEHKTRMKHYGNIAERMIQKIKTLQTFEQRRDLLVLTAQHMKKSFIAWNNDSVEDERIFSDIRLMYGEGVDIPANLVLPRFKESTQKKQGKNTNTFQNYNQNNAPAYKGKTNGGKRPFYKKPYA